MTFTLQGRAVDAADLALISQWIGTHPEWSRRRLSHALCEHWNWRNGVGQLKDMASRALLLKLHQRGAIQLPPRRQAPSRRMGARQGGQWSGDRWACVGPLGQLGPLEVEEVSADEVGRQEVGAALRQFHYLGFGGTVGENLQYVVRSRTGRLLACLVFGSAAWRCQARDQFIGWTAAQRQANLSRLTNNHRFLVLPWVHVPGLASWALSRVQRRLRGDWQDKYGHRIDLVETFVERDRFRATAYRAANWMRVGTTCGRTRQDRFHALQTPIKDVYVYPLDSRFRGRLCA